MMNKIKHFLRKHIVWVIAIIIWLLAVLMIKQPLFKWIAFFTGLIFYPFIDLLNKHLNGSKLKLLGLPYKDFITAWITFWGVIGIAVGIVQVQRQISNQDKQLRDNRFASGVELLGNPHESARIGGAYNLYFLASDFKEYREPACEILCAHIRTITGEKEYQEKYKDKPSNEIQTILDLLFKRDKFIFDECRKNLSGMFLNGANFEDATLSNVDLSYAKLSNVDLRNAKLSNVYFHVSVLIDVYFFLATLTDVYFSYATLSEVDFGNATLSDVSFYEAALIDVSFFLATLNDVSFNKSILSEVDFRYATLSYIDFYNAKLEPDKVNFEGTIPNLQGIPYEEITKYGRSLELTKSKKEETK